MAEYLNKEKIENKLREKARYYFDRYYNDKTALRYHHKAIGYESAADEIRMTLPENIWRNAEQDPPEENTPVFRTHNPMWYCSNCGGGIRYNTTLRTYEKHKKPVEEVNCFCRKCGAKMDLEPIYEREETNNDENT